MPPILWSWRSGEEGSKPAPTGWAAWSLLALSLLWAGCQSAPPPSHPSPPRSEWAEALRALDPADAPTPAYDLTAAWLRWQGDDLQIRVDLLAFQGADDLSLDIRIGDESAPEADPLLIHIPAPTDSARIVLDPGLATVTVTIPRPGVPARPRVDVTTPEDALIGLTPGGHPQAGHPQGMSLLVFYDTFAARFPAEALRNWDGAHSGPRGERHGLKHLLDAVETYQVPIVLLDLKTPESLSALDAMGVLPRIQQMEADGLLILPDQEGQEARFGLPASPFAWGQMDAHPFAFAPLDEPGHLYRPLFSQTTLLPIAAANEASQPTPEGPSLEVRRALLELALNGDESDLLVLGGSLQNTAWGSPGMVGVTLAYFASRPYIHVLNADDLLNFPAKTGQPEILPLPRDEALAQLEAHYRRLTEPALAFAETWQGAPLSSCASDLDKDNQPECVLANEQYLAVLDPQGARLTYLFSVAPTGREASRRGDSHSLQQLIGPSWQAAVGLGDRSRWDVSRGEAADPGAYPGAFTDLDDPFKAYQPAITGDTLVFTSLDGSRAKTYRLTETGLEVSYQVQEPVTTQIPLLVEPGTRFAPGWAGRYRRDEGVDGVRWGLENGPMAGVQAQGQIAMRAFDESLDLLAGPEDPDFSYPAGHFIPFPMAVVEVEVQAGPVRVWGEQ